VRLFRPNSALCQLVAHCGSYSSLGPGAARWASEATAAAAAGVLESISRASGVAGGPAELVRLSFADVLRTLEPRLSGDKWSRELGPAHAVVGLARRLRHPDLSPHAGALVPLAVAMFGGASPAFQTLGASLLAHCARELNAAEFRWFSEVVSRETALSLHSRSGDFLREALPCSVLCARILDSASLAQAGQAPSSTQLLEAWARQLSLRSESDFRVLFLRNILPLVDFLGAACVPFLSLLLPPLTEDLCYASAQSRVASLACLQSIIRSCWPR
jgi:hypothetical protein